MWGLMVRILNNFSILPWGENYMQATSIYQHQSPYQEQRNHLCHKSLWLMRLSASQKISSVFTVAVVPMVKEEILSTPLAMLGDWWSVHWHMLCKMQNFPVNNECNLTCCVLHNFVKGEDWILLMKTAFLSIYSKMCSSMILVSDWCLGLSEIIFPIFNVHK